MFDGVLNMLNFNQDDFEKALDIIKCKANEVPHYRELIQSEINYINHFLTYLNKADIDQLVAEYDNQKTDPHKDELDQGQLRRLFNSLKRITQQQKKVLNALYRPDPVQWQQTMDALYEHYLEFVTLSHKLRIPAFIEEKFKEIQSEKISQGLPQLGSLEAIFIAPVQRLPRYALLSKDFVKDIMEKLKKVEDKDHPVHAFTQSLLVFNLAMVQINKSMNEALLKMDQNFAREKLKKVGARSKKSVRTLLSLLGDIHVLDSDELKVTVKEFDFSASTVRDKAAIDQALEVDANKKLTPFLANKIFEDKLIKLLKSTIYRNTKGSHSTAEQIKPVAMLLQQVERQRTLNEQIDLKKALVRSYIKFTSVGGQANKYIDIIDNLLLGPLSRILAQNNQAVITRESLLGYLGEAMEKPQAFEELIVQRADSPYLGHKGRLKLE